MIEKINNVVLDLEQSQSTDDISLNETSQVTGLSKSDVSAVRSAPLWQLRDKLLKERSLVR